MHTQSAIHFAAAAEQTPQREVQLNGLRIHFHHLNESFDGFILLLIEQKIQPLKIRMRQHIRFREQLFDVDTRGQPPHSEKQGKDQQHPELKFHN